MPNKEAKRRGHPPGGLVSDAIVIWGGSRYYIYYSIKYRIWSQLGALSGGCRAIDLIEENAIRDNMHKLMRN
jgi:hypothetical protein